MSRPLTRSTIALFLSSLLLAGCASTHATDGPAGKAPAASEDAGEETDDAKKERELHELEQELALARAKLEVAELEKAEAMASAQTRLAQAESDMELAEAALAKFVEADMPTRLASAELDLQSAKDRAQEAADELAQIELMYENQDLNDKTAEFVVSRGRRNAERAAARIQIQEATVDALRERELAMEAARLQQALASKRAALEEAKRNQEIQGKRQEIALQEARNAVEAAELDLAEAREDA